MKLVHGPLTILTLTSHEFTPYSAQFLKQQQSYITQAIELLTKYLRFHSQIHHLYIPLPFLALIALETASGEHYSCLGIANIVLTEGNGI